MVNSIIYGILAFAAALLASIVLTPVAKAVAVRFDILDKPDARKNHSDPIPLLGGVSIYIAFILGLIVVFLSEYKTELVWLLAGSTLVFVAGLYDDRFAIRARWKLLVLFPLASMLLIAGDVRIMYWPLSRILSAYPDLGYWFSVILTIIWVVTITTSFAILDHMDGLCAGVAIIVALFFSILALWEGQYFIVIIALCLMGANIGFLRWNRWPAKVFMGDCGSLLIGFIISALAIMLQFPSLTPFNAWMIPVFVLAIPLFDTTLVIISRFRRGLSPVSSPGTDHFAHRLSSLGLGDSRAVNLIMFICIFTGLVALILKKASVIAAMIILVIFAIAAVVGIVKLENAPFKRQ